MRSRQIIAICSAPFLLSVAAHAHHSFAMFDAQKQVTIVGEVKEFQWTNPHTWIQVNVPDGKGNVVEWSVEGSSPINLARRGWKPSTVKPGDKVTMVVNPLKDGRIGGSFVSMVLADGTVVGPQGPQPVAGAASPASGAAK